MNKTEALKILDALASGCSPYTGEMLEDHAILNDRNVIRALQIAIDAMLARPLPQQPKQVAGATLDAADIITILELM